MPWVWLRRVKFGALQEIENAMNCWLFNTRPRQGAVIIQTRSTVFMYTDSDFTQRHSRWCFFDNLPVDTR